MSRKSNSLAINDILMCENLCWYYFIDPFENFSLSTMFQIDKNKWNIEKMKGDKTL